MNEPQDRAIAHVTARATGAALDPSWRVTLHFHPFCYPDSVFDSEHFAVASTASTLVALAERDARDPLDDYVEVARFGTPDLQR